MKTLCCCQQVLLKHERKQIDAGTDPRYQYWLAMDTTRQLVLSMCAVIQTLLNTEVPTVDYT